MRRYLVDKESFKDGTVYLEGDTFHHICEVCRQGIGSQFEVLTEDGKAFLVEIRVLQKKSATAIILDQRQLPQLKRPHLHLRISVPKFSTFEAVLEKAVELGVKSVQPFFSDFIYRLKINKGSAINSKISNTLTLGTYTFLKKLFLLLVHPVKAYFCVSHRFYCA